MVASAYWEPIRRYDRFSDDELLRRAARKSLKSFTRRMFPKYETARHIEVLIEALEWAVSTPDARLIVTMPPRHSKSLHVSENLPAWYLGRNPDKRVIAASHTAQLAYTFSRRVRNKIADSRYPFPNVTIAGDKGAVQAWDIEGRLGGYYAVGVGGAPTGSGGDLIVIDDPIRSAADADSETVRAALWEWYQGTIRTRLEPEGGIVITATRWHDEDLSGRLIAAEKTGGESWRHVDMPAIDDETKQALWPERWPLDALRKIQAAVGSRVWQSQYQGAPIPPEGETFHHNWWKFYTAQTRPKNEDFDAIIQSWDMTFRETVSGSYVVGQVWGRLAGNAYLLDQFRERCDFTRTLAAMRTMHTKWPQTREKLVEDKANGPAVVSALRDEIPGLIEVSPEGGKVARANAISWQIEAGNVFLPVAELAPWIDDFIAEALRFPLGTNDDQVDAMTQALIRIGRQSDFAPVDDDLNAFFRRAGVAVQ